MSLPVLTFSSLMQQMAAGLQGGARQLVDLTVGSVLRSLLEACASVILWLQWLTLQVLAATRAATSNGPDLDTWMADFSLYRLPGQAAVGVVVFSRYNLGMAAIIPVGAVITSLDGTAQFQVIEDDSNPAWNGAGGYTVAPQVASVTVPARCAGLGSFGNVQPSTVAVLTSPIPGVDTVTNLLPFTDGQDEESDAALRARFHLYINSLSLATETAILNAVASIQSGVRMIVTENVDPLFRYLPGSFLVTVDDGTGLPGAALISQVRTAVDTVRPIGSVFTVQGPHVVQVSVSMTLETSNPNTHSAVALAVQSSVSAWIKSIPIAGTLALSKLDAIAHGADSSVISVLSALINGEPLDVVAPINGVIMAISVTVS